MERHRTIALVDAESVERWLRKHLRLAAAGNCFSGMFFVVVGFIVLALACYFAAFVFLFTATRAGALLSLFSIQARMLRSSFLFSFIAVVVVLSFYGAVKNKRGFDYSDTRMRLFSPVFSGDMARAMRNLLCEVFVSGPRLVLLGCDNFSTAIKQSMADISVLAPVLLWLFRAGRKAHVQEIASVFRSFNTVRILPQLREIPGIIWLRTNSGTVLLSPELKDELRALLGEADPNSSAESEHFGASSQSPTDTVTPETQWYSILGLTPFSALPEVKKRYRELVKVYHPDAKIGCGAELVKEAEERLKQINAAYENILSRSIS